MITIVNQLQKGLTLSDALVKSLQEKRLSRQMLFNNSLFNWVHVVLNLFLIDQLSINTKILFFLTILFILSHNNFLNSKDFSHIYTFYKTFRLIWLKLLLHKKGQIKLEYYKFYSGN